MLHVVMMLSRVGLEPLLAQSSIFGALFEPCRRQQYHPKNNDTSDNASYKKKKTRNKKQKQNQNKQKT